MDSSENRRRFGGSARIALLCAVVFGLGMIAGSLSVGLHQLSASSSMSDSPAFATFEQTWNYVQDRYVLPEELDDTELLHGAARGMVEAVGDVGHSAFLDPVEAKSFRASLNGELIGIGVRLEFIGRYPEIIGTIAGSPAAAAGIESGDVILAIDGRDASRLSFTEVAAMLRGEEGVPVDLTIGRPLDDIEFDLTIERSRIDVDPVVLAWLPDGLVLIRLNEFSEGAADGLREALDEALKNDVTGIVLDMRGNPGGYVHEAKGVASEFLPEGSVLYIEQKRDEEPQAIELERDSGRARDIPLVVLVNETSASAAEIVAASLRDSGRAEVVGVNTFGTATVVSSFDLDDGSIAAIGTAVWTSPNGENARNVGIEPTVFVDLPPQAQEVQFDNGASLSLAEIEEVEDLQLLEATNILSGAVAPVSAMNA